MRLEVLKRREFRLVFLAQGVSVLGDRMVSVALAFAGLGLGGTANGLRSAAMAGGEIVGPAIAGVLVAGAGAGWAILADAATFAVSAACLVNLRLPARPAGERTTSFLTEMLDGWTAFRSRTWCGR